MSQLSQGCSTGVLSNVSGSTAKSFRVGQDGNTCRSVRDICGLIPVLDKTDRSAKGREGTRRTPYCPRKGAENYFFVHGGHGGAQRTAFCPRRARRGAEGRGGHQRLIGFAIVRINSAGVVDSRGADGMTAQVMGWRRLLAGILADSPFGGRACLLCVCARIRVLLLLTYPRRGTGRVLRRDV